MEPEYTVEYQKHLEALDKAQKRFDEYQSKKTATALSDLREAKFTREQKYTARYIKIADEEEVERMKKVWQRINHLTQVANISSEFEAGRISENMYAKSLKTLKP